MSADVAKPAGTPSYNKTLRMSFPAWIWERFHTNQGRLLLAAIVVAFVEPAVQIAYELTSMTKGESQAPGTSSDHGTLYRMLFTSEPFDLAISFSIVANLLAAWWLWSMFSSMHPNRVLSSQQPTGYSRTFDIRSNSVVQQIRSLGIAISLTWLLLYTIRLVANVDLLYEVTTSEFAYKGMYQDGRQQLIVVNRLVNGINSLFLLGWYVLLTNPFIDSEQAKAQSVRPGWVHVFKESIVKIATVTIALSWIAPSWSHGTHEIVSLSETAFVTVNTVAVLLLISRLDSKFLGVPPPVVFLLAAYASIQPFTIAVDTYLVTHQTLVDTAGTLAPHIPVKHDAAGDLVGVLGSLMVSMGGKVLIGGAVAWLCDVGRMHYYISTIASVERRLESMLLGHLRRITAGTADGAPLESVVIEPKWSFATDDRLFLCFKISTHDFVDLHVRARCRVLGLRLDTEQEAVEAIGIVFRVLNPRRNVHESSVDDEDAHLMSYGRPLTAASIQSSVHGFLVPAFGEDEMFVLALDWTKGPLKTAVRARAIQWEVDADRFDGSPFYVVPAAWNHSAELTFDQRAAPEGLS